MDAARSPFARAWPGISLPGLGFDSLRGDRGTYGLYGFDELPDLPEVVEGDLDWLASAPDAEAWAICEEPDPDDMAGALRALEASGLPLPTDFVALVSSPSLQVKVRSTTGCWIDLAATARRIDEGLLVRFLSDSQGCLFWYLFLPPGGGHAVVASGRFYGTPEEEKSLEPDEADQLADPDTKPRPLWFCAPSFSVFLRRFWLENEIGFALYADGTDAVFPPLAAAYIEAYRRRAGVLGSPA